MEWMKRMDRSIAQLITPRMTGAVHIIRISGEQSLAFLCKHTLLSLPLKLRYFYKTPFYKTKVQRQRLAAHQIKNQTANPEQSPFRIASSTLSLSSSNNTGQNAPSDPSASDSLSTTSGSQDIIDELLCVYFKHPHSYTGEDVVELHVHGSLFIVDQILTCALRADMLLAEPGEFTYRAYLHGKLSLEQAEAVDTLIASKSTYTRDNALKILEQKTSLHFKTIHERLLGMLARLESTIEFPEEDIPEIDETKATLYTTYTRELVVIQNYFRNILENYNSGRKLESGIKVAIIGPPNVGKSTLLNALLKAERALVSAVAGTTRDYIQDTIELAGVRFMLTDTAGIHATGDSIEQAGIAKTFDVLQGADILIILLALADVSVEENYTQLLKQLNELTALSHSQGSLERFSPLGKLPTQQPIFLYLNKRDVIAPSEWDELKQRLEVAKSFKQAQLRVNGVLSLTEDRDASTQQLTTDLQAYLKRFSTPSKTPATNIDVKSAVMAQELMDTEATTALLNVRQAVISQKIIDALEQMLELVALGESEEVLAEEFRLLNNYFAEMNLMLEHDQIYDTLFSKFCIGK